MNNDEQQTLIADGGRETQVWERGYMEVMCCQITGTLFDCWQSNETTEKKNKKKL